MAVAPLSAGAYAAVDAKLASQKKHRLRGAVERQSEWLSATVRGRPEPGAFKTRYRLRLWLDRSDSAMPRYQLDGVLAEINSIWAQAGICFEVRDQRFGNPRSSELTLRFIGGGEGLPVFGMYDGHTDMWTLDNPDLDPSPHPVRHAAARTASHELGHALGLKHFNDRHESIDALMSSGRRGYRLEPFQIHAARRFAANIGEPNRECAVPQLM